MDTPADAPGQEDRRDHRLVVVAIAGGADPAGERTPLADAETVTLDRMARLGVVGQFDSAAASSWEGFLRLLGLPDGPSLGACEAIGAGIEVPQGWSAYRADFVTLDENGVRDVRGGEIDGAEAQVLLEAVAAEAARSGLEARFGRLVGPRNLVLLPGPPVFCPSPHEAIDQPVATVLPPGGALRALHDAARAALASHDVNAVRLDLLENPANGLWPHGGGLAPEPRTGAPWWGARRTTLLGAGGAQRGLARWAGFEPNAPFRSDEALAAAALERLADHEVVVVRSSSVLAASAPGDPVAKRDALSALDARLLAPLLGALEERGAFSLLVAADSVIETATHRRVSGGLPFAALTSEPATEPADRAFTEQVCAASGLHAHGDRFADLLGVRPAGPRG